MSHYVCWALYNSVLFVGLLLCWPLALAYLLLVPKSRAGFFQKLGFLPDIALPTARKKRLWFHAVSVGEFNAIRGVVNQLQSQYDEQYEVVISTTTLTGQTLARQIYSDLPVFYFPYDFWPVVCLALGIIKPDALIVTETELWPNVLFACKFYNIPAMLLNGRLSERSASRYGYLKWLFKPVLQCFTLLAMQSDEDAERIKSLGAVASSVLVMGNLKFDIPVLQQESPEVALLRQQFGFNQDDLVLTFASTHVGEDAGFIDVYQSLLTQFPTLKMVLAPRHPERASEIEGLLKQVKLSYTLRSKITADRAADTSVIVLNSIGELVTVYGLSTVAVIGGSFNPKRGGQNPLEAIAQKTPVVFGPYMRNFRAMVQVLHQYQACKQLQTVTQLQEELTPLLQSTSQRQQQIERGVAMLSQNAGATEKAVQLIQQLC